MTIVPNKMDQLLLHKILIRARVTATKVYLDIIRIKVSFVLYREKQCNKVVTPAGYCGVAVAFPVKMV